jgi:hypothetical protein
MSKEEMEEYDRDMGQESPPDLVETSNAPDRIEICVAAETDAADNEGGTEARAPGLDIFTQAFVLRDEAGWQITHAGKTFLAALEAPIQVAAPIDKAAEPAPLLTRMPASPVIRTKRRRVRRRRAGRRHFAVAIDLRSN